MIDQIFQFLAQHPVDLAIGLFSYLAGSQIAKRGKYRSIGIFLQVSLLVMRITKHYFDTHPEARATVNPKLRKQIESLHETSHKQALGSKGKKEYVG